MSCLSRNFQLNLSDGLIDILDKVIEEHSDSLKQEKLKENIEGLKNKIYFLTILKNSSHHQDFYFKVVRSEDSSSPSSHNNLLWSVAVSSFFDSTLHN
jgi:hypothetical protein